MDYMDWELVSYLAQRDIDLIVDTIDACKAIALVELDMAVEDILPLFERKERTALMWEYKVNTLCRN